MGRYGAREFELSFRLNNSAFEDNEPGEIARILREIAVSVESGADYGKAIDFNGNTIGTWSREMPEDEESEDDED